MRISHTTSFLALAICGTAAAYALNTPHTLHRGKTPHLVQPHNAAPHSTMHHAAAPVAAPHAAAGVSAHAAVRSGHSATLRAASLRTTHRSYERFTGNSFATSDIFAADVTTGEDPVVRQAAIDALGGMNGTAVVINPANGRILAMVNQKLALSPGAEPCSTIKITVGMAALSEGIVTRDTMVQLAGFRMNMTQALAKSNNLYFEALGRQLGFERVEHYAREFGLGELAGYNIPGE